MPPGGHDFQSCRNDVGILNGMAVSHALPGYKYLPKINFNFSFVVAGILSLSVRIACANADPHLHVRSLGIADTASLMLSNATDPTASMLIIFAGF